MTKIRTQRTPNPNAWKYVLDRDVKLSGKVSYTEIPDCEHVPLAAALLRLANVTQVHLFENVLTVTQNGASDWAVLDPAVQSLIESMIGEHDPSFVDKVNRPRAVIRSDLPKEVAQIEEILDRTVRPGLQADGGDLEVGVEFFAQDTLDGLEGSHHRARAAATGALVAYRQDIAVQLEHLEVVAV